MGAKQMTQSDAVPRSRIVAHLGHHDAVTIPHDQADPDDRGMILTEVEDLVNHSSLSEVVEMGWAVDGVNDGELVWFDKVSRMA